MLKLSFYLGMDLNKCIKSYSPFRVIFESIVDYDQLTR